MNEVCEIPAIKTTDEEVEGILRETRTIAVVGLSPNDERDSNKVAKYLLEHGYKVIPVNPNHEEILGLKSYPDVIDIPEDIDVVDIFRKTSAVPEIIDSAIKKKAKTVWMQLGVINNEGARRAKEAGLKVVMNRCIKIEHMKMMKEQKDEVR